MSNDTSIALALAHAVKRAMQLHEDSYDHAAADAATAEDEARIARIVAEKPNDLIARCPQVDYAKFYRKSIVQACEEAAPPGCGYLLYLAVSTWWNDAADWADQIIKDD